MSFSGRPLGNVSPFSFRCEEELATPSPSSASSAPASFGKRKIIWWKFWEHWQSHENLSGNMTGKLGKPYIFEKKITIFDFFIFLKLDYHQKMWKKI
jgi:hypothetical protein